MPLDRVGGKHSSMYRLCHGWYNPLQSSRRTLNKVQKKCVVLMRSENTFSLLQLSSVGKKILKCKKKTFVPKIILHSYILYKCDLTYIGICPVNLGMGLMFTDLPTGSGSSPGAVPEIC